MISNSEQFRRLVSDQLKLLCNKDGLKSYGSSGDQPSTKTGDSDPLCGTVIPILEEDATVNAPTQEWGLDFEVTAGTQMEILQPRCPFLLEVSAPTILLFPSVTFRFNLRTINLDVSG